MFKKNNKTFYLIFLFVVISLHTYILTTVLSVSKSTNKQVNVDQILKKDSLNVNKVKSTPAQNKVPSYLNNISINNINRQQK
jgi:hypothetical protein